MKQELKNFTPLYKVVGACVMDMREDMTRVEEQYYHWAARGVQKLNREILRMGFQKALLLVNKGTRTATLPCDFKSARFVGYLNNKGEKIPMTPNAALVDQSNLKQPVCEEECPQCHQDKQACKALDLKQEATLSFVHNGTSYFKVSTKQLYDNGDYYEEVTIPVLNLETNTVTTDTQKNFVAHLDKKKCGCLETTPSNLKKIRKCDEEAYCCYYAPSCDCDETTTGTYKIFEETGLIQLSLDSNIDKIYIEYNGFLPKLNGMYVIPEVAFETLVEWTKWKSIQNKSGIGPTEKQMQRMAYETERKNMLIVLGRVSLSRILSIALSIPKFDTSPNIHRLGNRGIC